MNSRTRMQMLPSEKASIVAVTPKLAERWLTLNYDGQRRLKPDTVARYARDMAAGVWHGDNGQSITFSADGWLVDGQHRLRAVIESGCEVEMLVVRSSQDAAQIMATIDVGDRREAKQLYHGLNATTVCAMAKTRLCLEYGDQSIRGCIRGELSLKNGRVSPTVAEVLDYIEEHEDELQEDCRLARRAYAKNCSGATLRTCHNTISIARFCQLDGRLEDFCADFGAAMPRTETVAYLKRFLLNAKSHRGQRLTMDVELDAMLRAYDAFREGRACKAYNRTSNLSIEKWSGYVDARRTEL